MHKAIICIGGRKFLLTLGCGLVTATLCWFGKIDGGVYATVTIATVGVYIAGNTMQKSKEIEAENEPT